MTMEVRFRINAASASTQISGLPFSGPIAGVRLALIGDQWVAFPKASQLEEAVFDLTVAGRVVTDAAGNKLGGTGTSGTGDGSFTGQTYAIDKTAPTVSVTQLNGAARAFPYSTNQNVTSVGGSCSTGDGLVFVYLNASPTTPATATCTSGAWSLTLSSALSAEATYTFSAAHKFVSDVTTASGVLHVTSSALASKTVTDGVADAADVAFTAVTANAGNHSVLIFQASAVTGGADVAASAQRLIGWVDTGTNFPIVPNGGDVTIAWDNGANKIFKL